MASKVITYEALREIQRNERKSERLVELDDSFYKNVEEYFIRKSPKNSIQETEIRNAKSILRDIVDRREKKILKRFGPDTTAPGIILK